MIPISSFYTPSGIATVIVLYLNKKTCSTLHDANFYIKSKTLTEAKDYSQDTLNHH